MSDETSSRITRPHPEAMQIAQHVGAILKSEETGEYRKEVLIKLTTIELNQHHLSDTLAKHMIEDKEALKSHDAKIGFLERNQNRIIGALIFLAAVAGVVAKFGGIK